MDRGLAGKGLSALALQLLVVHARCGVGGDELVRELQDSVHIDAGMGLVVFFSLPALALSGSTTETAVFVYESLAQLAFVSPARRITSGSLPNKTLDIIIVASVRSRS